MCAYSDNLSVLGHGVSDHKLQRRHYQNAHNGSDYSTYSQIHVQQIDNHRYLKKKNILKINY